ncbi:hypothetical protein [Hymenobacter sp. CRA2]|uniref:hypothetical protein n=1 Tax=Hymenobacter sp. CRA2 TaxID=1955620 RepID=UPI00098F39B5|nr:hypothetical protein [Hymenobacter sp. CRA2]OON66728.1 hypothetical protein B0919_21330 [Hymenobacter sp. CRA2]
MKALPTLASWVLLLFPLLGGCSEVRNGHGAPADALTASLRVNGLAADASLLAPERRRRIQRGDTASLPSQALAQYLPAAVAGFVSEGQPQGDLVRIGGINYSTCEQYYRRGSQQLKVQVVDYNGAMALYDGATALMSTEFLQESDEQFTRGFDLGVPGVRGFETVQKMERRASVALGVGERFFVSVESTGQEDTKLVKDVARTLDLRALAAL